MSPANATRIAVIADAHYHDLSGCFDLAGENDGTCPQSFRRLAETARSTRVFNEGHGALIYTLDDIIARDIRHVVLLGDYSDDGQIATLAALRCILDRYSTEFGLRFYATVGNHDIFGPDGRHRTKRVLNDLGGYDIVTSDPSFTDSDAGKITLSNGMYCPGYPLGLQALPDLGFFGVSGSLYWEAPFGGDDRAPTPAEQGAALPPPQIDASYLVEPFEGVWLLMIDANVFRPLAKGAPGQNAETYADSTDAGWTAMLTHKAVVLRWIKDVCDRARQRGKHLLAFSHYPVLDPLDGTRADERKLFGTAGLAARLPGPGVAQAIIDTGVGVHFSGHLHVNDTARFRNHSGFVVNVSVPSLVAFPPAYKIIHVSGSRLVVETIDIGAMPLNPDITARYQHEVSQTNLVAGRLIGCATYGQFLNEHIGHLVTRRHLRREWPRDLASVMHRLTLADLALLALTESPRGAQGVLADLDALRSPIQVARLALIETTARLDTGTLARVASISFLEDWYRLRMGSEIAADRISAGRLAAFGLVSSLYARGTWRDANCIQTQLARIFRMYAKYLGGLPSRNFTIDLLTGDIARRSSPANSDPRRAGDKEP